MKPEEITACLRRNGVPASPLLQELIALEVLTRTLVSNVANLAAYTRGIHDAAREMLARQSEAE